MDDVAGQEEKDAARRECLSWINTARAEVGAPPLELDENACSAADAHCEEMVRFVFCSHWSLDGRKPQQRYARAGLLEHVSEQLLSFEAAEGEPFGSDSESLLRMMRDAHSQFMEEPEEGSQGLAPRDDVLNPTHTHVGVGTAVSEGHFRFVVLFMSRCAELQQSGLGADITGRVLASEEMGPYACAVYYDPPPQPLSAEEANSRSGYPEPGERVTVIWPWQIEVDGSGGFHFALDLAALTGSGEGKDGEELREGSYHVQLFARSDPGTIPYGEAIEGLEVPAPGLIRASAVVLNHPTEAEATVENDAVELGDEETLLAEVRIMPPGVDVPDGFELADLGAASDASYPTLCCRRRGDDAEAIVGLAIAQGVEDVPPGFEIVGPDAVELGLYLCGHEGKEGKESKDVAEGDALANPEGPMFLCSRTSSDAVEIAAKGLTQITVSLGGDFEIEQLETGGFERLSVTGKLSILYKLVGSVMDVNNDEDGDLADEGWADLEDDAELLDDDLEEDEGALGVDSTLEEGGKGMLVDSEERMEELEAAERAARSARLEQMIADARDERERLVSENQTLQKKLVPLMTKKQPDEGKDEQGASFSELEKNYNNSLKAVNDARAALQHAQSGYDRVAMDLQTRLDEKESKAIEIRDSFMQFKREIAKAAENTRTGKAIPRKIIRQFEIAEEAKDAEVERVRLKNINLRTQLRKLESSLREKEQLAEGLHLIDFEQLKIENQTLNEKIEERNEELHKLRKKTTTTVQVLTHIKEKLQFVQGEVSLLKRKLAGLDDQVVQERDRLTRAKHGRDKLRQENDAARQEQGFVNSSLLVQDFTKRKHDMEVLAQQLNQLKERHFHLSRS